MKIIFVLCFISFATARHDHEKIWESYRKDFSKNYSSTDDVARAKYFLKKCVQENEFHNRQFDKGRVTFSVGVNDFSDGDLTELRDVLLPILHPFPTRVDAYPFPLMFPPGPPSLDYSQYLQPVVSQGSCGSCWAFSTVGQLESLYARNVPPYRYKFSPQYLMDCDRLPPNKGCFGGWPRIAMEFILLNGITNGSSYCYQGVQSATCLLPPPQNVQPRIGRISIQYNLYGNEEYLKNILAVEGPLVVTIWASDLFMKYKSGVFSDTLTNCVPNCNIVNHAVLLIGYGVDALTRVPYWLLRNSWGTRWGEAGNFRMIRNGTNNCNTACYALFIRQRTV